jgi:hypothetical protein
LALPQPLFCGPIAFAGCDCGGLDADCKRLGKAISENCGSLIGASITLAVGQTVPMGSIVVLHKNSRV